MGLSALRFQLSIAGRLIGLGDGLGMKSKRKRYQIILITPHPPCLRFLLWRDFPQDRTIIGSSHQLLLSCYLLIF
jgi:hypothetical protein